MLKSHYFWGEEVGENVKIKTENNPTTLPKISFWR